VDNWPRATAGGGAAHRRPRPGAGLLWCHSDPHRGI
jgi:hypothetical protein